MRDTLYYCYHLLSYGHNKKKMLNEGRRKMNIFIEQGFHFELLCLSDLEKNLFVVSVNILAEEG